MPPIDRSILDQHEQKYQLSCIPACVELVLKQLKKVAPDYYEQQEAWQNKSDGSFGNYNEHELFGLRFRNLFSEYPRDAAFPLADLFARIDAELDAGRFVIISLRSTSGWHMYVVHSRTNGEFESVSKASPPPGTTTIEENRVKAVVSHMGGTDILVYEDV